ncbi:hypothetical protein ID866_7380 [Astraeus odoratus]|nr:hypothetical protein ID866_7380 [Astraeus odoratus]
MAEVINKIREVQTISKVEVNPLQLAPRCVKSRNIFSRNADPELALELLAQSALRHKVDIIASDAIDKDKNTVIRGGFAYVYLGYLLPYGEKVAVKTLRGRPTGNEGTIKRALKEVHFWSKLHHDNILPLLGITTKFDQTISFVSPWIENGNAHDYVRNKSVDPRPLIEGIARGLHYMHTHSSGPIFHGDPKGLNVLVTEDGRALLTDFGLSLVDPSSFSMSVSGPGGGTVNWVAPEILEGHGEISAAADVWTFGMTALVACFCFLPCDQPKVS